MTAEIPEETSPRFGDELRHFVVGQINSYVYQAPSGLVGNPWSPDKVARYLEKMRGSLVQPYPQMFELRETAEQVRSDTPRLMQYWVVAVGDGEYVEWYDPKAGEFGLGLKRDAGSPISIGVRGDAVGVFMAM